MQFTGSFVALLTFVSAALAAPSKRAQCGNGRTANNEAVCDSSCLLLPSAYGGLVLCLVQCS